MRDINTNWEREIENVSYKSSSDGFENNLVPKSILSNRENELTTIKNQVLVKAIKFPLTIAANGKRR